MKWLRLIMAGVLVIGVAFFVVQADGRKSPATSERAAATAQVQLPWVSINSGGLNELSSTNFASGVSIGQPVSGTSQSTNYKVTFGFWQTGVNVDTEVEEVVTENLPTTYMLFQNYPNPFNPSTVVEFTVPVRSHVKLAVYNLLGQRVATLVDEPLSRGTYRTVWNGRDGSGSTAASGVYLYRLQAGDMVATRKMVLLK